MVDIFIVDRIEGSIVVCEIRGATIEVPVCVFPTGVRSGDSFIQTEKGFKQVKNPIEKEVKGLLDTLI